MAQNRGKCQSIYVCVKKSTEKYDQKLDEKYQKIVATIEQASKEDPKAELEEMQTKDVHPVTSEKITQTIQNLEKRLQDEPKNKTMKKQNTSEKRIFFHAK